MIDTGARTDTKSIRVAIVERYALVRAAIRDLLANAPDLLITVEEPTVPAALDRLRDEPADVVLVHAALTGTALVATIQQLKRECPTTAVVILGNRHDDNELFWAIQAGAAGHVAAATKGEDLAARIRSAAAGEYSIDAEVAARPILARHILEAFRDASHAARVLDPDVTPRTLVRLTPRETEVLTAISEGLSNKEIAATLLISQHTVGNTVKSVLRKLAVNNRTRAVLLAIRESWIAVPAHLTRPPH